MLWLTSFYFIHLRVYYQPYLLYLTGFRMLIGNKLHHCRIHIRQQIVQLWMKIFIYAIDRVTCMEVQCVVNIKMVLRCISEGILFLKFTRTYNVLACKLCNHCYYEIIDCLLMLWSCEREMGSSFSFASNQKYYGIWHS